MSKLSQLQDIDLKLLRCFCTIVEEGSFTAAQASLNLSQSSLSDHLKTLEVRLGVTLCQRGPKGFKLFDEGREVYLAAMELFSSIETFKQSITNINKGSAGELLIAVQDAIIDNPASLIPEAIRQFTQAYGGIRIRVEVTLGFQVIGRVADGLVPVGIALQSQRFSHLNFSYLFDEVLSLYCGRDHPLFSYPEEDITEDIIKSFPYCNRGHLETMHPDWAVHVPMAGDIGLGAHAQLALVLSGRNLGYISEHIAQPSVASGLLRCVRPDLTRRIGRVSAVTGPSTANFKVARSFVELLARVHAEHREADRGGVTRTGSDGERSPRQRSGW